MAVDGNGLPISIVMSPANIHDSTKFIDVMENISEYLDVNSIKQITSVYADKGYDQWHHQKLFKKQKHQRLYPKKKLQNKQQAIIQSK